MGRIVLIKHNTENWSAYMTEEAAKMFSEPFPENTFTIEPIKIISFETAYQFWDKFMENL